MPLTGGLAAKLRSARAIVCLVAAWLVAGLALSVFPAAAQAALITIAPATLPNAVTGMAYSQTLTASGGQSPYSFAVAAGALPAGLTLSMGGTLSGTPVAGGTSNFTVIATDANGSSGSRVYSLTVGSPTLTITPTSVPPAMVGASYSQTLTASGGAAPYTYGITAGALPAGLMLSSGGTISGTPTSAGSFNFTVVATDSNGFSGSQGYTLRVNTPTITISPPTLPNGNVGADYTQSITASGGTAPYSYAVTAGALPPRLTLASNGVLSGTPTQSGSFTFTVTATDASTGAGAPYSASRSYTLTIATATTTTTLNSAPNPSMSGQAVTLTANVSSAGGTPTGTVTFTSGGATLGSQPLNGNGQASITTSALPAGSDLITATFTPGNSAFTGSTGSVTQQVNAAATTTTLTSAPNPSMSSQAVTLTATVSSAGGTPTGTVTFTSGGTTLGSAALAGGKATLTTSALPVGSDAIMASYAGTTAFAASTGTTTQTVGAANTTTTVTSAPNPSTSGQAVTLTATVASASGTPTGTVTFTSNGATLGTANLANGVATLTTSTLPVGTDAIVASYGGAPGFTQSSGTTTQTVGAATTTTTVTAAPNPSTSGQSVTLTANVTSAGGTPAGTVTFTSNGATLGTATLANGTATLATSALPVGNDAIVASYGGATGFAASTGTTVEVVQAAPVVATTTTLAASPNPSAAGQTVRLTATVRPATASTATPTGTVTFRNGSDVLGTAAVAGGTATFSTNALPSGSDTLTAAYSGDASFTPSTSAAFVQQVQAATGSVTLTVQSTGRNGSFSFTSTLPGGRSFTLATGAGTASRTFANLSAGTYSITAAALPLGFVAQGFTCSNGSGNGKTETFALAAGGTVACTFSANFDAAGIQNATQAAIRTYLQQRAEIISQAEPDHRRMHQRLTGSVLGGEDETTASPYGKLPIEVNGFSALASTNMTATTSLSQLLRPAEKLPFEVWTDVRVGSFRDSPSYGLVGLTPSHYQGNTTIAFAGADYRVWPGVLFGVLGEYDQIGQTSSTLGTSADGRGYMVGPYTSIALTRHLFFDARAAFGQSTNEITPDGLLPDHFSTDRQLYRGELSGLFNLGTLEVSPSIAALYFQEHQKGFEDAFGLQIGSQTVGLGQMTVGPEFAYPLAIDSIVVTPRFAVAAVYDFQRDLAAAQALGVSEPTAALRARIEGGLNIDDWAGFGISSSISYDGVGDRSYSAITGRLSVKKSFDGRPDGVFATQ